MKIIKKGTIIPFTCEACGCEFLAGKNSVRGDNDGNYYVECPTCAAECYAGIIDVQKYERQQSLIKKGE